MGNKYRARYITIACVVAMLFGILVVRLFNLQIAGYEDNLASAESKKTKIITSQGSRGTIMDVNSLTLAYDKQIYNVQFYRDPNYTPTDIDSETGKTISQYKVYTNAIINVIDIIEKNGGTLNTSFSLKQDEMTGLWIFSWNNNSYTQEIPYSGRTGYGKEDSDFECLGNDAEQCVPFSANHHRIQRQLGNGHRN